MTKPVRLRLDRVDTPTGVMRVVADGEGRLRALDWETHDTRMQRLLRLRCGPGVELAAEDDPSGVSTKLRRWFAGDLDAFEGVEIELGGTPFQREVWAALRAIPAGETLSYGALAARIGRPAAVRAVGLANGANAVALAVPCHRVIGKDASLTGYGGGLERKRWLLDHERAHAGRRTVGRVAA